MVCGVLCSLWEVVSFHVTYCKQIIFRFNAQQMVAFEIIGFRGSLLYLDDSYKLRSTQQTPARNVCPNNVSNFVLELEKIICICGSPWAFDFWRWQRGEIYCCVCMCTLYIYTVYIKKCTYYYIFTNYTHIYICICYMLFIYIYIFIYLLNMYIYTWQHLFPTNFRRKNHREMCRSLTRQEAKNVKELLPRKAHGTDPTATGRWFVQHSSTVNGLV